MAGPLGGVKVIELGTMAAVPGGAAILAEWGADVLKVEDPGGGDPARTLNVIPDAAGRGEAGPLWEQANRNKRSAAIDIRNERGRAGGRHVRFSRPRPAHRGSVARGRLHLGRHHRAQGRGRDSVGGALTLAHPSRPRHRRA